jgi:hypothetical protein
MQIPYDPANTLVAGNGEGNKVTEPLCRKQEFYYASRLGADKFSKP